MRAGLELVLERPRKKGPHANPSIIEVPLGTCRFVEIQDGWITAWGGNEEMPVELWIFSADDIEGVYAWPVDGRAIEHDNWEWNGTRLNILSAKERLCETDYMAGQICMLPEGHEGSHR